MPNTRSPVIVIVNDEEAPLRSCEIILRRLYKDVDLILLQDSVEALQKLSIQNPDLLITGTWFPRVKGKDFVELLMERGAAYPIIVMSAYEPEESWVREQQTRGRKITFLGLPFELATFKEVVAASLKIIPDPLN
jgi:DNA-binding NtrC family response regulator